MPGLFHWSDGAVCILGMWFGPGLQMEQGWSEVPAKVDAQVGTWLRKRLSLKGRLEVCAVFIFFILHCFLYFLCLRLISWLCYDPSPNCFGEVEDRWSADLSAVNIRAKLKADVSLGENHCFFANPSQPSWVLWTFSVSEWTVSGLSEGLRFGSFPGVARLVDRGGLLQWNWAPVSGFLNNPEFSLSWWLTRNPLPLLSLNYKTGRSDMPIVFATAVA